MTGAQRDVTTPALNISERRGSASHEHAGTKQVSGRERKTGPKATYKAYFDFRLLG